MSTKGPTRRGGSTDLAGGLASWFLYISIKRGAKPVRWVLSHVRRILFSWKDYTRYLREQSIIEGVFGGRKLWLVLAGGLWGARAIRKASSRTERVVLREVIAPGDRIVIHQMPRKAPRPSRRERRAS